MANKKLSEYSPISAAISSTIIPVVDNSTGTLENRYITAGNLFLNIPSNGLKVGTTQLVVTGGNVRVGNSLRVGNEVASPMYGRVSVHDTQTTLNIHGFEDYSLLSETINAANGYASFDAYPYLSGAGDISHYVGFQSRPRFAGTGEITNYLDSMNSSPIVSGGGTVTQVRGLHIIDASDGTGGAPVGTITYDYGIYIEAITAGASDNYSIWSNGGKSYFVGNIGIGGFNWSAPLNVCAPSAVVNSLESAGTLNLYSTTAYGANIGPQLRFSGENGGGTVTPYAFATIAGRKENATINDGNGYLQFSVNYFWAITEAMRISSYRNLLIGTTTDTPYIGGCLVVNNVLAHRGTKAGFFNKAPADQPTKAGHNNWVAIDDVVDALVELGLVDAA